MRKQYRRLLIIILTLLLFAAVFVYFTTFYKPSVVKKMERISREDVEQIYVYTYAGESDKTPLSEEEMLEFVMLMNNLDIRGIGTTYYEDIGWHYTSMFHIKWKDGTSTDYASNTAIHVIDGVGYEPWNTLEDSNKLIDYYHMLNEKYYMVNMYGISYSDIHLRDIRLELKEGAVTETGAAFIVHNDTALDIYLDDKYAIMKVWEDADEYMVDWTDAQYFVKGGSELEITVDWSEEYGELPAGVYRLAKYYTTDTSLVSKEIICEFVILR